MDVNDYNLIEQYLSGELTPKEQKDFQLRIQTDKAFAEAYQLRKSMNVFLEKKEEMPGRAKQLNELGELFFTEKKDEKTKVIPLYRKKWIIGALAAAVITLLIIIGNPLQKKDLYPQYAQHERLSLVEKSTNHSSAAQAEQLFNQGKYPEAYSPLKTYLEEFPESSKAQLALGISALEMGKTSEAIQIFEKIHNGNTILKPYGTWYLALTYLKSKESEKVKSYLNEIPKSEKKLYQKARKLLEQLN